MSDQLQKQVTSADAIDIEDYHVYTALTSIRGTSEGPDGLPSWLLSTMAHLLATPISYLYKKSLTESYIPPQWKESKITPIPKISRPVTEADYRPISITPVLCKILEKFVVHIYYYPILTNPKENSLYSDQYAFRPSGSTSAALIAITHHLLETVNCEPYARMISLDFSKAFDTVRHNYLAEQLASMLIPDFVYNWVLSLLSNRVHCTKFCGIISSFKCINCSMVQGSGLGPIHFLACISGLKLLHAGNRLFKYADDCYLVIPASNITTTDSELAHIAEWARNCNLRLNHSKSCEIIIRRPFTKILDTPLPIAGILRVNEIKILGVTLSEKIGFSSHINNICCIAKQSFYALRVLVSHGLTGSRLHDVVRSTTVARMLYSSPVWWGFTNSGERDRLSALIRKLKRQGFLPSDTPTFDQLCSKADDALFAAILHDPGHVLHDLLPPIRISVYSLRPRSHNREIPRCDPLTGKGFITRLLYK